MLVPKKGIQIYTTAKQYSDADTVLSVQTKVRDKGNNRDMGLLTGDNLLYHLESLHDTPDSIGQVFFHPQLNSTIQLQCREGHKSQ